MTTAWRTTARTNPKKKPSIQTRDTHFAFVQQHLNLNILNWLVTGQQVFLEEHYDISEKLYNIDKDNIASEIVQGQ